MGVGDAFPIRIGAQNGVRSGKLIGGLSERCSRRHLSGFDAFGKRRLLKKVELIAVDTVQRKRRGGAHIVFPDGFRLHRKAVDQVDNSCDLRVLREQLNALHHFVLVVQTLHGQTNLVVESLYAQRNAVDTAFYSRIESLGCHVVHTTFERDFAIGSQRQIVVRSLQNAAKVGRG